jgi:RNA polymerase sigma factor (sigma-70 family)
LLDADTKIGGAGARFPDTHQSALVKVCSAQPAERLLAYEAVLAAYWKPIYRYVRLKWHKSNEDAKDLTQAFFTLAVEKDFFRQFDREKGSFRTYLRTCVDRFLSNEQRFASRQKRSALVLPLEDVAAHELSSGDLSPEELFQRDCARSLFSAAIEQLRMTLRPIAFAVFQRFDLAEPVDRLSYQQIAAELEVPVTAVTNFLALARRELRRILLEHLQQITRDDIELRREARELFRQ